MKFKDYVEACNKLLKERPEAGEYETIYARDDEGNGYQVVNWTPSLGIKDNEPYWCEFISEGNLLDDPEDYDQTVADLNSVCIN